MGLKSQRDNASLEFIRMLYPSGDLTLNSRS